MKMMATVGSSAGTSYFSHPIGMIFLNLPLENYSGSIFCDEKSTCETFHSSIDHCCHDFKFRHNYFMIPNESLCKVNHQLKISTRADVLLENERRNIEGCGRSWNIFPTVVIQPLYYLDYTTKKVRCIDLEKVPTVVNCFLYQPVCFRSYHVLMGIS